MKRLLLSASILLSCFLANAQFGYLRGEFSGANEVPPNGSTATGVVIVKYNTATNLLELWGDYRGLTSAATAAHIHEAPVGVAGPVVVPLTFSGGTDGTVTGTATITDAQEATLLAGGMYVNVHSSTFPDGEIRAQLMATPGGQTDFLESRLQASQEVPPKPSTAMGHSYALLDRTTNTLYLTGDYSGLAANITGSHIHTGLPGATGPIIIPLNNSGGTSGVLDGVATVTDAQETELSSGATYTNVHSSGTYPGGSYAGGEIRGQLTNYSQLTYFAGTLSQAEETPPTGSTGTGTVIVRYDPITNLLELTGDYQTLSSTITGSHIHGPAAPGSPAPVLYEITNTGGNTGTLSLSTTITDAEEADLYSGLWYVNVHSTTFPGGELRVQLYNTHVGHSYYFTGFLQGSQEVPPTGSAGTGTVTSLVDAISGNVWVTGSFSGLSSNATVAHVHQARPGTSGPVILPLAVSAFDFGTVTGTGTLTPDQVVAMVNGDMYVNIHSVNFPDGELRAQLGNFVLPVKLLYFNAVKEGDKVALSWSSAQETNLASYTVEQQHPETGAWTRKGTVTPTGGNSTATYRLTDAPMKGRSPYALYRLRITDADGKTAYSTIAKVNIATGKGELQILSNPVTGGTLRYVINGLQANGKAEASVVDYSGRVVVKASASLLANNEINVSSLPAGMYRLVINVNNEILQQSFVK